METRQGDLVLIHHKSQPVGYARVEDIVADVKPGWWQITLLLLQIPTTNVTWILRDEYIDGAEFTMSGEAMTLERLPRPKSVEEPEPDPPEPKPKQKGKVVSLLDRRRS